MIEYNTLNIYHFSTLPKYGFSAYDFQIQTNEEVIVYIENKKRGCLLKPNGFFRQPLNTFNWYNHLN